MKTQSERMRESLDELDNNGSREIYVDGFGTWDAASLRSKIIRDVHNMADSANKGNFETIKSTLSNGVFQAIVAALVDAEAEDYDE